MIELSLKLLLLSAWIIPLLLAWPVAAGRRWGLRLAPFAAVPAVLVAVYTLWAQTDLSVSLPWLLLGSRFGVDRVGEAFLLCSSVLWWCAGIYCSYYLQNDKKITRFFTFFLLAMAGNLGLILAQDLISFFTFFALMSFASYGLVVHENSQLALQAGRLYIGLVIVSEVLLWSALVLIARQSDTLDFAQLSLFAFAGNSSQLTAVLIICGLGIKAGLLGLHVWLPLAHSVSPTPASAVLSGAMIKAGLLGWLRLLPLGQVALISVGSWLLIAGIGAAFLGVIVGCLQHNSKTVLAYSSVSQMGLMIAIIAVGLIVPELWPQLLPALLIYVVHHALVKGSLFLGVGVVRARSGPAWMRIGLMVWLALALAGAPLGSGMLAKSAFKQGLEGVLDYQWLIGVLALSSIATGLLMSRCLFLLWQEQKAGTGHGSTPLPSAGLLWPWVMSTVASVSLVWCIPLFVVPGVLVIDPVASVVLWAATWPCLIAIGIALIGWRLVKIKSVSVLLSCRFLQVPAGDVAIPVAWIWSRLKAVLLHYFLHPLPQQLRLWQETTTTAGATLTGRWLLRVERQLLRWSVAIVLLLVLVLAFMLLAK